MTGAIFTKFHRLLRVIVPAFRRPRLVLASIHDHDQEAHSHRQARVWG